MTALPQNDTPVLAVYGKTRAGKGEYISTAVRFQTGEELNISSSGMLSHTKEARGYPSSLNGTQMVFYDTVGFGDSDCTNLAEETLLRMLEATGTQPFYPPLYILKDLDSANIDALRKLTSIFPEVCVAVRGSDETFKSVRQSDYGTFHGKKKRKFQYNKPVTLKDEVPVTVEVSRKKITTTRFSYSRDISQVYKVLTGNIRIYMTNEIGIWMETGQEVVNVQDIKA
eukprot:g5707.t1